MAFKTSCVTSSGNASQWDPKLVPALLQSIPPMVSDEDYPEAFSSWSRAAGKKVSSLYPAVCKALHSLIRGRQGDVALVKIGVNQFAAECTDDKGETTVVVCNSKGNVRAAVVKATGRFVQLPTLPDREADLSPLFAVYIGLLSETDMLDGDSVAAEVSGALDTLTKSEAPGDEIRAVHLINDVLVTGFDKGILPCRISNGNIDLLTSEQVRLNFSKGKIICGNPRILAKENSPESQQTVTAAEAKEMFSEYAQSRSWSESEERLIPEFDDDYPVMPETLEIARHFVGSRSDRRIRRPMKNFLWRGITSYGKSTGIEMLACILHTPLLRVTCSSGMEAQDFLSQFVPESGGGIKAELPSFSDIMFDPESAYETITGQYKEGATCEDALIAYGNARSNEVKGGSAKFRLVESNFVTALKNGYICEIQEMSRIKDAGTMVSLNEYDRAGALIPLADGSFARRHEDAMVVYTDNIGYASCRQVDPSVMRRMDCVIDSYELSDEQVAARVRYNTGFDDQARLYAMMRVWKSVVDYCRTNEITEGEISVNELERWVTVYLLDGADGYRDGCRRCVVSKASPDRETQEEIWTQAALPLLEAE